MLKNLTLLTGIHFPVNYTTYFIQQRCQWNVNCALISLFEIVEHFPLKLLPCPGSRESVVPEWLKVLVIKGLITDSVAIDSGVGSDGCSVTIDDTTTSFRWSVEGFGLGHWCKNALDKGEKRKVVGGGRSG